jgi:hypothetical protein
MINKLKAIQEDFKKLYANGVISVNEDRIHLENKLFKELAFEGPITAEWNDKWHITVSAVVDGVKLITLL